MEPSDIEIDPGRRARLIVKGHLLYAKYCGRDGLGICAERFALHHIRLGETIVARDLLAYLDERIQELAINDSDCRMAMTRSLADRIRDHLETEN